MAIGSQGISLIYNNLRLDYTPDTLIGLGSQPDPVLETYPEEKYSFYGSLSQVKPLYVPKLLWNLRIRITLLQLLELQMLLYQWQAGIKIQPWIVMLDRRIPYVEPITKTRQTAPGSTDPSVDPVAYYPVYRVSARIKDFDLVGTNRSKVPVFDVSLEIEEQDGSPAA